MTKMKKKKFKQLGSSMIVTPKKVMMNASLERDLLRNCTISLIPDSPISLWLKSQWWRTGASSKTNSARPWKSNQHPWRRISRMLESNLTRELRPPISLRRINWKSLTIDTTSCSKKRLSSRMRTLKLWRRWTSSTLITTMSCKTFMRRRFSLSRTPKIGWDRLKRRRRLTMRIESSKCRRVLKMLSSSCSQDSRSSWKRSRTTMIDLKGRPTVSRCSMRRRSLNRMTMIVVKPSNWMNLTSWRSENCKTSSTPSKRTSKQ